MKKIITAALAIFIVASCNNRESPKIKQNARQFKDTLSEKIIFRNISWEMNKDQVIKNEAGNLVKEGITEDGNFELVFVDQVMNETAMIFYFFNNSRINRVTIDYDIDPLQDKEIIKKYD